MFEELKKDSRAFSESTTESESKYPESPLSITSETSKITLSDFQTIKLIGEGGYGKVFLVKKKVEPNKVYAMKVLKKADLWNPKRIRSVRTEREVLTSIKHPNIVNLNYVLQNSTRFYFIMEYCRGNYSSQLIGGELFFNLQNGRFGERKARFYAANVVLALECLHEHHILYREYIRIVAIVLSQKM